MEFICVRQTPKLKRKKEAQFPDILQLSIQHMVIQIHLLLKVIGSHLVQDGRVERHVLISSCKSTSSATSCGTTIHRRALELTKKRCLMSKDKNEAVMRWQEGYNCNKNKSHIYWAGLQCLTAGTGHWQNSPGRAQPEEARRITIPQWLEQKPHYRKLIMMKNQSYIPDEEMR